MKNLLIFLSIAIAFLSGVHWGISSDMPSSLYSSFRYNLRQSLNLEKNWAKIPDQGSHHRRQPIPCPHASRALVLVTGGQSNAANSVPTRRTSPDSVSVWFDGKCFPADEPLLGASGIGGSIWLDVAEGLQKETGRPVLLINGAIGGTQYEDWTDPRSGYLDALLTRVREAEAQGFAPAYILWHQGETDAKSENDMVRLERVIAELSQSLLEAVSSAKLYMFVASKCIGPGRTDGVASVREAQIAAVKSLHRVVLGMNTDDLGNEYRWDTCHFNNLARGKIAARVVPELVQGMGAPN